MSQSIRVIVERQISRWNAERKAMEENAKEETTPRPVITISRQLGAGGAEIAHKVARRLECELIGWRVVNEVAERIDVRQEIAQMLDEKTRSLISSWFNQLRNTPTVDEDAYHRMLIGTVRSFMELGSVVLLGRGANFVTTERPKVKIQVIAPLEYRIRRLMVRDHMSRNEALGAIEESDTQRSRYIRRLFGEDWANPLHYNLTINTADLPSDVSAALIEAAWLRYVTKLSTDSQEKKVAI